MIHTAKLLIVDDSPENRLLLKVFLKQYPVQVDEAADGAQAVARLRTEHYDLVLMDVHMPVMDGLSATRAIRRQEHERGLRATTILALTADDSEQDKQDTLQAGCNAHLVKPISRDALWRELQRWLGETPGAPGN